MTLYALLSAAAAAAMAVLFALILKLAGGGRGDLIAPPKRKPRRLSAEELDGLTELVGQGGGEEAVRRLRSAGYDEAAAKRLVRLMARLAEG